MAGELTVDGLDIPRIPEVREFIVENWKAKFGDNAQTGSDSPDGLEIDILTILYALLWEADGEIWANGYFRTASGVSLDLILDLFAKKRIPAAASTASLVWYGADTIAIPLGSVASVADVPTSRFATDAAGDTGDDLVFVWRVSDAIDTETYTATINGTDFDFVAGPTDTPETVVAGLAALINAGAEPVDAIALAILDDAGRGLLVVDSDDGVTTFTAAASATGSATIDVQDGARVAATATETGPLTGLAGTISTIETSIGSIVGVVNTADATVGRNRETDAEYKQRHLETLNSSGCGTPAAIEARILLNVPDVESVKVFENDTDAVDADGRPPHSFETFVLGGDDTAIATEILACKPAGIETVGDVSILLPATTKPIKFSRPTERYLHLEVTITQGEGYPTTGDPEAAIIAALATALGGGGSHELEQGDDLYRAQLFGIITDAVAGIATIDIETDDTAAPLDVPTFTPSDIVVDDDEILISDSTRITVIGA